MSSSSSSNSGLSLEQITKEMELSKFTLDKLSETFDSFQAHSETSATLLKEWSNYVRRFRSVEELLVTRVKELERREREDSEMFRKLEDASEYLGVRRGNVRRYERDVSLREQGLVEREKRVGEAESVVKLERRFVKEERERVKVEWEELERRRREVEEAERRFRGEFGRRVLVEEREREVERLENEVEVAERRKKEVDERLREEFEANALVEERAREIMGGRLKGEFETRVLLKEREMMVELEWKKVREERERMEKEVELERKKVREERERIESEVELVWKNVRESREAVEKEKMEIEERRRTVEEAERRFERGGLLDEHQNVINKVTIEGNGANEVLKMLTPKEENIDMNVGKLEIKEKEMNATCERVGLSKKRLFSDLNEGTGIDERRIELELEEKHIDNVDERCEEGEVEAEVKRLAAVQLKVEEILGIRRP